MPLFIELENYQGPFDVLLELLNRRQLDIAEVSLAKITDDYLHYIADLELSLEEMNWFLFVATKLTYDKSIAILAIRQPDEELDLTEALKNYAIIKRRVKIIAEQSKNPLYNRLGVELTGPIKLCSKDVLLEIYSNAMNSYVHRPVSRTINSKSDQLMKIREWFLEHISNLRDFNSSEVLINSKTRNEAAIYLLTLLDLLRKGELTLQHGKYNLVGGR